MDYATARPLIRSGDLIGIMGSRTIASRLTRIVMMLCGGRPYTHVGVALWQAGRLYIVEENGGGDHLTPLSQWSAEHIDVARPLIVESDDLVQAAVDSVLADHVPYGVTTFVAIGLRRLTGIDLGHVGPPVCSSFAADLLRRLGWAPAGLHPTPAPDEVMSAAGAILIQVIP